MGDLAAPTARRGRVEDHCCIDVSVLRKTSQLEPRACGVWSWSRGTGIIGAVSLVTKPTLSRSPDMSPPARASRRWSRCCSWRVSQPDLPTDPAAEVAALYRPSCSALTARADAESSTSLAHNIGRDCHRLGFAVETRCPNDLYLQSR